MTTPFTDADRRWLSAVGEQVQRGGQLAPPALFLAPVRFGPRSRTPDPAGGADRHDLVGHLASYGPRPDATRGGGSTLLAALDQSALTGHGGGHFPVAAKSRIALAAGGGGTIVAN